MKRQALLDCIQAAKEHYHKPWACVSVDLTIQVLPVNERLVLWRDQKECLRTAHLPLGTTQSVCHEQQTPHLKAAFSCSALTLSELLT